MSALQQVLVFGLAAGSFIAFADYRDAPLKTVYEVEVRCYRVSADVSEKTEGVAAVAVKTFRKDEIDVEGVRLRIDGDMLLWNGKPELAVD